MFSALALASVTAILKDLLENELAKEGVASKIGGDAAVSVLPPDRIASGAEEKAQLNLFLYLVTPHPQLRGNGHRDGIALELHYLLSAYGQQDLQTEILLGYALQILHQNPVLPRDRVRTALRALSRSRDRRVIPPALGALAESDLADRVERLRIEPDFLTAEESSRLWSALQARYRPSATYKVIAVPADGEAGP